MDCRAEVQDEVQKLLEQGFFVEVPAEKVNHDTPEWYLPLQAVFTPDRTTKVRLVFDASAKGPNEKSLNEHLEKEPNYINNFPNVLMAWRFDKVACTGDMRSIDISRVKPTRFTKKSRSLLNQARSKEVHNLSLRKGYRIVSKISIEYLLHQ